MTDIDLMSETQVAVMTVAAIGLWTALAWTLYRRRPRRRSTYVSRMRAAIGEAKRALNIHN